MHTWLRQLAFGERIERDVYDDYSSPYGLREPSTLPYFTEANTNKNRAYEAAPDPFAKDDVPQPHSQDGDSDEDKGSKDDEQNHEYEKKRYQLCASRACRGTIAVQIK